MLPAKSSDELTVFYGQTVVIFDEVLIFEIELLLPILKHQLFSFDTLILFLLCIQLHIDIFGFFLNGLTASCCQSQSQRPTPSSLTPFGL